MVVQEMTRVMLHNKKMPRSFWGEAVNTACHTLNRVYFRLDSKKTPYEIWRGKNLLSNTSGYLAVTITFCVIGRTLKNLMQRATRDTFWDTLPLVEHIEYTT